MIPEFGVTVSRYVPARTAQISPLETVVAHLLNREIRRGHRAGIGVVAVRSDEAHIKGMLPVIVKTPAGDVPPAGDGLTTVTSALPAKAMSEAGIATVRTVALT